METRSVHNDCVFEAVHIPPEIEGKPLVFGTKSIAGPEVDAVQKQLEQRVDVDQAMRNGPFQPETIIAVDMDNTAYAEKLVREFGWIDAKRFGAKSAGQAFLLVQHSNHLPLMLASIVEIEKDLKAGLLADGDAYALLYDRLQTSVGTRQRYGTQLTYEPDGGLSLYPLENRDKVDEYRIEMGLGSLAEYLKSYGKTVMIRE